MNESVKTMNLNKNTIFDFVYKLLPKRKIGQRFWKMKSTLKTSLVYMMLQVKSALRNYSAY